MTANSPHTLLVAALVTIGSLSGALAQDEADTADPVAAAAEDFSFDREGRSCVRTRAIRSTDILDDRRILFEMRGGEYYLNNLAYECRGLRRAGSFSYQSTGGRLCNVDSIRVIERVGGLRAGIGCGLDTFYPITAEEAEFLRAEADRWRGRPRPEIRVENPDAEDEANDP